MKFLRTTSKRITQCKICGKRIREHKGLNKSLKYLLGLYPSGNLALFPIDKECAKILKDFLMTNTTFLGDSEGIGVIEPLRARELKKFLLLLD